MTAFPSLQNTHLYMKFETFFFNSVLTLLPLSTYLNDMLARTLVYSVVLAERHYIRLFSSFYIF